MNISSQERDALVIAIGKYSKHSCFEHKLFPHLVAQAEELAKMLETQGGFKVKRLPAVKLNDSEIIDSEQMVSADELKFAIEDFLLPDGNNQPNTSLLFFVGHGLRKQVGNDYEGFLATSEANPNRNRWGFSLQELRRLLDKSSIQQQIVWIDACHSGEFLDLLGFGNLVGLVARDRCFISSARAHEEAYAEGLLTQALLETLDYTKQLNPWVDHLTLIEWLKVKNQTLPGSQRFVFANTDKPIILTNKPFDVGVDYKDVCPFKGLESFDFAKNRDDPLYFKGRTALVDELLEKVQAANFLAVLGASGNGKSSVVRAGLLYQLQQTQRWEILPVITPTADPLRVLGSVIGMVQLSDFIDRVQAERVVLVVDQFEEVFALCKDDEQRQQFLAILLAAVVRADNKFCLVVVMRADFLDKCSHNVDLAKQIQAHQIIVTPMTAVELEEAIVAPTQLVGLQIEPKLVAEMLADVKGALGSLPLLQYTLRELWAKCAGFRLLTFAAYEELGKIAGTLEKKANGVYEELSLPEQKIAKRVFIELTQLGEGTPDTRRQLSQADLVTLLPFESTPIEEVIQRLITANLLVTDKSEDGAVVNISHDALIGGWARLRGWIDDNRDFRRWCDWLRGELNSWLNGDKEDKGLLITGEVRLSESEEKLTKHAEQLNDTEKRYIEDSLKYRDYTNKELKRLLAETEEQAETNLLQSLVAQSRLATAKPSPVNGYFDTALLLATQAFKIKSTPNTLGALLDVVQEKSQILFFLHGHTKAVNCTAISPDGQLLASGSVDKTIIIWNIKQQQTIGSPLRGHSDEVTSVNFSPDNKYLVSGSEDKTVIIWNIERQQVLGVPLCGHSARVWSVVFSPDGKHLASGGMDKTVIIWDVKQQKSLGIPLHGHSHWVRCVAFSPDSKYLASGGNEVIIWNIEQQQIQGVPLHRKTHEPLWSIVFSPDGKYLAGGSEEKIIIWNISHQFWFTRFYKKLKYIFTQTEEVQSTSLCKHSDWVRSVAFTHDNKYLISGSNEIIIWNVKQKRVLKSFLLGHNNNIQSITFNLNNDRFAITRKDGKEITIWDLKQKQVLGVTLPRRSNGSKNITFSPDGKYLASASRDKIIIWNVEQQQALESPLCGHSGWVTSVTFSPNGKYLVSGSKDKTIIIWNVEQQQALGSPLCGHSDWVTSVTFSPDGKCFVSGSRDKTIIIWNVEQQQALGVPLSGHSDWVTSVIFSPDSKCLASGSKDKTIIIWNIEQQQALGSPLCGHSDWVTSVTFSPDGQYLASGSIDKTIIIWEVERQQSIGIPLYGHSCGVTSVAFSPNGQYLASSSGRFSQYTDGSIIIIWDVKQRQALGTPLQERSTGITSLAFNPNGQYLASGSNDGPIIFWDMEPQSWFTKVWKKVNRNFTQEEWKKYMGDRPYEKTFPNLPEGK
ncbi:caspase family protein [Candidatus Halobeggiatoa sp. HSG11]|nr:caspase family protein [Candidatus Halobeggiatoa sp. HSG11]